MKSEADLEGAYRHLSSESVDVGDILLPHLLATRERVKRAGTAYVLHDTTDFVFGGEARRPGLAHVNSRTDQGFRAHVSLAVGLDRMTPLGVLAVGTSSRDDADRSGSEADRWFRAMDISSAHVGHPAALIHVADRESDIYQLLVQAQSRDWRYIIRAAQDRAVLVESGASRLFEAVSNGEPMFEMDVPLSARSTKGRAPHQRRAFPTRRCRVANLAFSAMTITLLRPRKGSTKLPEQLTVNAVRVWEPDAPEGEPAVEWVLLTSEPIASKAQVRAIVDGYRTRWTIEIFFNALKSGCSFERKQLESVHSLVNFLGYCIVVAYAMLVYRAFSRDDHQTPASAVLTPRQLECLRLLTEGKLEKKPTAQQALQRIARLGGHLKRNGPPGWRTLSRGFQRLREFEQAYILIAAAKK
jgi:hypothetical protein